MILAAIALGASSLISLVLTLAIVGLIVWAITTFIPMDARFKQVIYIVVGIVLLIWLVRWLQSSGLIT